GFRHGLRRLVHSEPFNPLRFIGRMRLSANQAASERQSYDAQLHVLVDAGELVSVDLYPGLFEHFSGHALGWCLVQLQDATGWNPAAVVIALDRQDAAVVAEHDAGHADGVTR